MFKYLLIFCLVSGSLQAQEVVPEGTSYRLTNEETYRMKAAELMAKKEYEQAMRDTKAQELQDPYDKQTKRQQLDTFKNRYNQPSIVIEGKRYDSWEEFTKTQHYRDWHAMNTVRNHWNQEKKRLDAIYYAQQRKEWFRNLNERLNMSWYDKHIAEANKRAEKYMGEKGPWLEESLYIPLPEPDEFEKLIEERDSKKNTAALKPYKEKEGEATKTYR
jgi:hypothetical protein